MKSPSFLDQYSRNLGLLSSNEQECIAEKKVLIAGCGLGSQIALAATRLGFCRFRLVDPDIVELSNLNRQAFGSSQVGKPKAEALASVLKEVNPLIEADFLCDAVKKSNAMAMVEGIDLIIDAIDPVALPDEIALHRIAREQNIPIVQPTDLGWGGMVQVFKQDSESFESLCRLPADIDTDQISPESIPEILMTLYAEYMPPYLLSVAVKVIKGELSAYPQPATSSFLVAGLASYLLSQLAIGKPVPLAPDGLIYDPSQTSCWIRSHRRRKRSVAVSRIIAMKRKLWKK